MKTEVIETALHWRKKIYAKYFTVKYMLNVNVDIVRPLRILSKRDLLLMRRLFFYISGETILLKIS